MNNRRDSGRSTRSATQRQPTAATSYLCEADVASGLGFVAHDELNTLPGRLQFQPTEPQRTGPDLLRFMYSGNVRALLRLKTVLAVYLVRSFAVPRPKALLSNEHLPVLIEQIALIRDMHPPGAFANIELSAAGAESSVMRRIVDELAQRTGLEPAVERGDLFLRLRPTPSGGGWDALMRLGPRPLSTRAWRVCSREGSLNATVAHAMALLTQPHPEDIFLNLACGSGSLLIERLAIMSAQRTIGCDTSPEALACARQNLAAAGYTELVELTSWDARKLPLPAASVSVLCADLPFGHLVGSHAQNLLLYPAVVAEAARVARPNALFALITHEVRLAESLLAHSPLWATERVIPITQGGLHPRIFLLRRR